MRVGILTGGGDCPGLNAVIRAIVRKGETMHGDELIGFHDAWDGVMERRFMTLDVASLRGMLPKGGTLLGTRRGSPYDHPDGPERVQATFREMGLDALIVIGGNGSLTVTSKLYDDLRLPLVGVPKTIDNDVVGTDVTFGFHTAVQIATDAIDRLHTTAESHDRVMVVEVMGRHTGWIATHAGIAGGATAILIPEQPFDIEEVCDLLRKRHERGRYASIVVVAEGAVAAGKGAMYLDDRASTHTIARRLGGVGTKVAEDIAEACGADTRATVLGHVQRGGSPSPFDRVLGTRFGCAAAHLVAKGAHGRMVALRGADIIDCAIADAIREPKLVSPNGELVTAARSLGVSFGD